ncbi:MAG: Nitroreductase [Candidatus Alkanophagales archaeon MCA70_species_1]|nr:Nitroreductase [Candidatus Alkanophaga volatiphilum]
MPLRGERERMLLIAVAMFIGLTGVIVAPLKMQLEIGDIAMPSDAELKLLPCTAGETSVEEAITLHGPIRGYPDEPLTVQELLQLLWAAQGITDPKGGTAPSAGVTYPLETWWLMRGRFRT